MIRKIVSLLAVSVILILPIASCGKTSNAKSTERVKLRIDYDKESKLQLSVENGYQLWRLNPIDVAHGALTDSHVMSDYNAFKILMIEKDRAVVTTKYKDTTYNVHLARLVKPSGIWTATEIEKVE